jgi:hypothetical protein
MLRRVGLQLPILACLFVVAGAEEPVSISDLLTDPDVYHLHVVTIQGIVREVRELDPYVLPSGTACYGAYTFTLEDDGGSTIEISVLGACGPPLLRVPDVADGDNVQVQAEIHAPGRTGYSRALGVVPGPGSDQSVVQAIARSISRVAE